MAEDKLAKHFENMRKARKEGASLRCSFGIWRAG